MLTCEQVVIVVLNWNRADDTTTCLTSLAGADLRGARVLVVDNGSHDDSVRMLRERFPAQRILALPENEGYAGGSNAGIRAALAEGAQAILLLNNDTTVARDFLQPLVQAMNESSIAAAVSSAVMRMDVPELMDVAYLEVHLDRHRIVRLQGVNALPSEGFETRRVVQVGTGCSLLLRAEALEKVGLFDEAFFAYHEEVDWSLRARRMGYEIIWEPLSRVFHKGSGSTQHLQRRPSLTQNLEDWPDLPNAGELELPWNPVRAYLGARNSVRLIRKHANRQQTARFVRSTIEAILLELSSIAAGREGWFRLRRWSWADVRRVYFVERHALGRWLRARGAPSAAMLLLIPFWIVDVVYVLPRDLWRAHRAGRIAEMGEHLRGLWDGLWSRRLPLIRLGLRSSTPR
jgi:GT2 family glycosyltransferase